MMAGVVGKSTQYLTDTDLGTIAEYLKSLPSSNDEGRGTADSARQAQAASTTMRALLSGETGVPGSRVYLDNCNACHGVSGTGAIRTFPNLVHNEAVSGQKPVSLIHIVLAGSATPSTHAAPSVLAMPGFALRLSDWEVADVLNFVRNGWGNRATAVSPDAVGRVRKAIGIQTPEPRMNDSKRNIAP
jgi:mono/diheme cytochrome c family protein